MILALTRMASSYHTDHHDTEAVTYVASFSGPLRLAGAALYTLNVSPSR